MVGTCVLVGLDEKCEVGQGGTFYTDGKRVTTFLGTVVSEDTSRTGQSLTFRRSGKVFRGRMSKEHDMFNFRRVA
jgi:hypothetical protein